MLQNYLQPIDIQYFETENYTPESWFYNLQLYTQSGFLPDLSAIHLAIIGVQEGRGSVQQVCEKSPNAIRQQLYKLINWEMGFKVADLGNIVSGSTLHDTHFALAKVVQRLVSQDIIPIILGGTYNLTYAQFWGHTQSQSWVNATVIDKTIEIEDNENEITAHNFLYRLLTQQPKLLHFAHLCHQRYLVAPTVLETLENLNFECCDIDFLKKNLQHIEPTLRNATMLSCNLNALQYAHAPAALQATPNGLLPREFCQLVQFAGLSSTVKSIGFYNYNPLKDNDLQITAQLIAQAIWYFVEGYYARQHEFPELNNPNFLQYITNFKDPYQQIIFLKSKKTDRWWMKVPSETKPHAYHLIPCSYYDYETACNSDIPERWMRAYLRVNQ